MHEKKQFLENHIFVELSFLSSNVLYFVLFSVMTNNVTSEIAK